MQSKTIIFKTGIRVIFPVDCLQAVYQHCRRKLAGDFLAHESHEPKAFGLIAGEQQNLDLQVVSCLPFMKNARQSEPYKKYMDEVMDRYAIPSETPISKRGWIAEPQELLCNLKEIQDNGMVLLGAYHMHRVGWPDDPLRDTPTKLDTILAADSSMLMFIISMVDHNKPLIRAFYEGNPDKEVPIIIKENA